MNYTDIGVYFAYWVTGDYAYLGRRVDSMPSLC
jgi:hypothetical protein